MRRWQLWWRNLAVVSQQNPPQIVEGVMLLLALWLCGAWFWLQSWQYLVLCLSYIMGAIASMLAREFAAPSAHTQQIRLTAWLSLLFLFLVVGFYMVKTAHSP